MDFDGTIAALNELLSTQQPETFSSSWILRNAPSCYHFIQRHIRSEFGGIDWDTVTYALEWKYQKRWHPGKKRKNIRPYEDQAEVEAALNRHREKLYVFIAPIDAADRRIRNIICTILVRMAQRGNLSAKQELIKLIRYTIDDWIERYRFFSRWRGYDDYIEEKLECCIRRYRYSGSFTTYVYRTLELTGRGIRPLHAYSLDEPIAGDSEKRRIENVIQDAETNEIGIYGR